MKRKCQRCDGKKVYKKQCCVKCGGKGYTDDSDRALIKQLKLIAKENK